MDILEINVLLIEDDPGDTYLMQVYLTSGKHNRIRVSLAERMVDGLKKIQEERFDIILLDLSLPDISGIETLQKFRVSAPDLPIVILSGLDDDEIILEALHSGAQDYLSKANLDPQTLIRTINYAIERKKIENSLRESESLYRSLVEISPDSITLLDMNLCFVFGNPQSYRMLGLEPGDNIKGLNALYQVVPADRPKAEEGIKKVLETGSVRNMELHVRRHDGSTFLGEVSLQITYNSANQPLGFIAVMRDITERKKIEKSLMSSQKLASLGALAAGIAHEINSPLQVITGLSDSLRTQLENIEGEGPKMAQHAQMINRSGWRVAEIVRSLLSFARMSSNELEETDLNDLIQDTLLLIEHQLRSWSNIMIFTELAPDLPYLRCDHNKITQVIINLLINARDAMPNGGKILIRTGFDHPTGRILLEISDTGLGIPENVQEKIFDPFFTTKPLGQGTGLGLSIASGIIQVHGGEIQVQSHPEVGTKFSIFLPLDAQTKETANEDPIQPEREGIFPGMDPTES